VKILLAVPEREQSGREEIANSISHGIGLIASLMATPFLIMYAVQCADTGIHRRGKSLRGNDGVALSFFYALSCPAARQGQACV